MAYRFFVYKAVPRRNDWDFEFDKRLETVESGLLKHHAHYPDDPEKNAFFEANRKYLSAVSVEKISAELTACLKRDPDGTVRGSVTNLSADSNRAVFCVSVPFADAEIAADALSAVAFRNRLALFDPQKDWRLVKGDYSDDACAALLERSAQINGTLADTKLGIRNFLLLEPLPDGSVPDDNCPVSRSYGIVFRYEKGVPFRQKVEDFYAALRRLLIPGETLVCKNRCFTVTAVNYRLSYCLEGYKGSGGLCGWREKGEVHVEYQRHMSMRRAYNVLNRMGKKERERVFGWMSLYEQLQNYPNPAARLAHCVKLFHWMYRYPLGVGYGPMRGHFHFEPVSVWKPENWAPDRYADRSVMVMGESSACYILTAIADFYPYIWDRYYDDTYLHAEVWRDVLKRLGELRKLVLNDPYSEELRPYLERNDDPYELRYYTEEITLADWEAAVAALDREYPQYRDSDAPEKWIANRACQIHMAQYKPDSPSRVAADHRKELAHLYEIFMRWLGVILETRGDDCLIRVSGP